MDGNQPQNQEPSWQFKPGEAISPRQDQPASVQPPVTSSPEVQQQQLSPETPTVTDSVLTPTPTAPPVSVPPAPVATQNSVPTDSPQGKTQEAPLDGNYISWTASEFIAHEKSAGWHTGVIVIASILAALTWFITKDIVTALIFVVAGVVLSFYGARRPNQLQYQLGDQGLQIGNRYYSFGDFRSYSIVPEGAIASIALTPSKRFAPMVTLYFDPQDGDRIIDILGLHLPHQDRKADAIDGLMRKIRF